MAKTRAIDMLCRMTWAITEPALRQMVLIAQRQNDLAHWQAVKDQQLPIHEGTHTADLVHGVGVLPVQGPIFRHANLFTDFSGATSLDMLAKEFRILVDDDTVESILLEIDSPGGEAAGINEFADMIYAAREKKPIYAYADDLCASAGYWIASACHKIFTAETAAIGSIGVIAAMHKPPTAEDDYVEFISAQSPYKRPLYKEDGGDRVQMMVDKMADIFVAKVARNRGVDEGHVLEHFGEGWVKIGQDAVTSGLADDIGTFASVLHNMFELRGTTQSTDSTKASGPVQIRVSAETPAIDNIEEFCKRMSANMRDSITKLMPAASALEAIGDHTHTSSTSTGVTNDNGGAPMEAVVTSTEEELVEQNENPTQPAVVTPAIDASASRNTDDAQRVRALEQQIESLRMERHTSEATAFADVAMAERRVFPAEREPLIAAMTQAAMDDLRIGGTTSRVELIKTLVSARPQHQLTIESLAPALAEVLNRGDRSTMTQGDDRPLDAKQLEELIGKTPVGKAALTSIRTGQPMAAGR